MTTPRAKSQKHEAPKLAFFIVYEREWRLRYQAQDGWINNKTWHPKGYVRGNGVYGEGRQLTASRETGSMIGTGSPRGT